MNKTQGLVFNPIAFNSKMKDIIELIKHISQFNEIVFFNGESGTGKSMLSRLVHHYSPRREEKFVEINCASLNETLLESELFGHARGSFTGALKNRIGKLLEAQKGTLLLDDISEASLGMQAKLLHVFEEKTIQSVGSNKNIHLDVHFICASNKDMRLEVEKNRFREDLYYRTHIVNIEIPPLRERKEDILPLIRFFLKHFERKYSKSELALTEKSKELALSYHWPGNVRELKNTLARSVMLSKGTGVNLHLLDHSICTNKIYGNAKQNLRTALANYEKKLIYNTLTTSHWDYSLACQELGISRSSLFNKKKKFGLKRTDH